MSKSSAARQITRDDLEAKFRKVHGGTQSSANTARSAGRATGVIIVIAAIGIAYMLGRRRGRRRRTVVEVRRI